MLPNGTQRRMAYLDQNIEHILKAPLNTVPALVPPPSLEQVVVHWSLVHQYMLRQL